MKNLRVTGVSVHIGSQITDVEAIRRSHGAGRCCWSASCARTAKIEYVDAGGGLGIPTRNGAAMDLSESCRGLFEGAYSTVAGTECACAAGAGTLHRGACGCAGYAGDVRKPTAARRFVVVDAAMNDLLRPALYGAHHEIVPVRRREDPSFRCEAVDVVGPVCESGDFFARDRELPRVEEGELLAILDAGAYGMVLASNYNTRPRPAEMLVSGKSAKIIRRREKVADLLRDER